MEFITEQSVDDQIGRFSSYLDRIVRIIDEKVNYLGGLESFDSLLVSKGKSEISVTIRIRPRGLEINKIMFSGDYRVAIPYDDIQYIVIEPQTQIIEKKSKSIVGRVLIGGLLLGPVGAVIGGISAIPDKKVKVNPYDNIMVIKLKDSKDSALLFSVPSSNLIAVQQCFQSYLRDKFKLPIEISDFVIPQDENKLDNAKMIESPIVVEMENKQMIEQSSVKESNGKSMIDELEKLAAMLERGLITKDEFDKLKSNVINGTS